MIASFLECLAGFWLGYFFTGVILSRGRHSIAPLAIYATLFAFVYIVWRHL